MCDSGADWVKRSVVISGIFTFICLAASIPAWIHAAPKRGALEGTASIAPSNGGFGWRYTPVQSRFGTNSVISGLSNKNGQLEVTIAQTIISSSASPMITRYYAARWNPASNQFQAPVSASKNAPGYTGPIQLNFPTLLPMHDETQSVSILDHGHPVVAWPSSIPLYGSAQTPQTSAPGSLDNQIIGTSGNWLWVALKGPQEPPFRPKESSVVAGFRYWNRLVALNMRSGAYHVYAIPRTYTLYESEWGVTQPAFAQVGNQVCVSVGRWIGTFPANPSTMIDTSEIRIPAPSQVVRQNGETALSDLQSLEWQEISSLAAYWDNVVKANVPGMPTYFDGENPSAWNTDPVIMNHGALPTSLIWAMEYPYNANSGIAKERDALANEVLQLLKSKLNQYAMSPATMTYATVRNAFSGKAPLTLPGYTIRNNAYWPNRPSVLNRGTPSLPADFRTYQSVLQTVGQRLALRTSYVALLPVPGDNRSARALLTLPKGRYFDVRYQLYQGDVPHGYRLSLYVGPKQPPNSAAIPTSDHGLVYRIVGVTKGEQLPADMRITKTVAISGAHPIAVRLGNQIQGTEWVGTRNGTRETSISWKQGSMTWMISPAAVSSVEMIHAAERLKTQIAALQFPSPLAGYGVLSYGQNQPSEVVWNTYSATYALYANGWRAPLLAAVATTPPTTY